MVVLAVEVTPPLKSERSPEASPKFTPPVLEKVTALVRVLELPFRVTAYPWAAVFKVVMVRLPPIVMVLSVSVRVTVVAEREPVMVVSSLWVTVKVVMPLPEAAVMSPSVPEFKVRAFDPPVMIPNVRLLPVAVPPLLVVSIVTSEPRVTAPN